MRAHLSESVSYLRDIPQYSMADLVQLAVIVTLVGVLTMRVGINDTTGMEMSDATNSICKFVSGRV